MPVKIRLARRGRKKLALYDVIIADSRAPRDGRFIEKIGTYNPNTNPATIVLNDDRAFKWVMDGAQPTDTVRAMLSYRGVMLKRHLQIGVNKGAVTQEQADTRFDEWKNQKESRITGKTDTLIQQKTDAVKARLEAEAKVKEARAEAIRKKKTPPVAEMPATEAPAEETAAEETAAEETAAEETAAVETAAVETAAVETAAEEASATEDTVE